ncbi:MAG: maleylpyruvate isomerase N-terminal domain-containing protein, partial [Deltaproteobacteria bacterium]|nr:maleylpyruvate isomerase N-terminal domain-containing protein [Deltaproteobacteria bacterium]
MQKILQDLKDEQEALDRIVAGLGSDGWETKTPADWTVKQQIAHI